MVKREINLLDGELNILEIILGSSSPDDVIKGAIANGFKIKSLELRAVEKEGPWESTKKSTEIKPVIYLEKEPNEMAIIFHGFNGHYQLAKYRFIP